MTGLTLAHYRIDDELGRGGMGIVYKATDTKLNRTVALKVLPPAALSSEDDRARFFREAQSAAALHHPNIATVFQIDEAVPRSADGGVVEGQTEPRLFIAMEYIEGETLYDRIKKGPFPLKDAVSVAGQIAEALKEAHAKDIVHRDIKSHNVMLTGDGIAKVLDFGLAKTNQSTMLTRMGSTLGTVAYMSPEQARGQAVDGRTDLYSLGTVMYEMIAGRLPFAADYEQAILYSILNEPPEPLTALRTGVPMELERITSKLLAKEAEYRYQSAAGLLADLKSLDLSTPTGTHSRAGVTAAMAAAPGPGPGRRIPIWMLAAAGVLLLGVGTALGALYLKDSSPARPIRMAIELPEAMQQFSAEWTPDGEAIYYTASHSGGTNTNIRRYDVATGESAVVSGTEGASYVHISPDGRWLVYYDGRIYMRKPLDGGEPSALPGGEAWADWAVYDEEGRFYLTDNTRNLSVVEPDGERRALTRRDSTVSVAVIPLPLGSEVLFTNWDTVQFSLGTFRLADTETGYVPLSSRYTYFQLLPNDYAMMLPVGATTQPVAVAPINPVSGDLEGTPIPYARMDIWTVAVSPQGHLIYREIVGGVAAEVEPVYVMNSAGQAREVAVPPGPSDDFAAARTAPMIAIEARAEVGDLEDIYVIDQRTGVETRLSREKENQYPEWSPDDQYVYWRQRPAADTGNFAILRRVANASAPPEVVLFDSTQTASGMTHPEISPDGSTLYFGWVREAGTDTYRIPLTDQLPLDPAEAELVMGGPGGQNPMDVSPDGRYLIVRSGGRLVVTSAQGQGEVEITTDGDEPVWSPDGDWIYFTRATSRQVVRVPVTTDPLFSVTGPEELHFEVQSHLHLSVAYDSAPMISVGGGLGAESESRRIWLVMNFRDEIERIAPRD